MITLVIVGLATALLFEGVGGAARLSLRLGDEAARLDSGDQIRRCADAGRHAIDAGGKAGAIEQQRSDVAELDAGLGIIPDRAHGIGQRRIAVSVHDGLHGWRDNNNSSS
jgi:hypothetical protein